MHLSNEGLIGRHGSGKRIASGVGEGSMTVAYIHEFLAFDKRYK